MTYQYKHQRQRPDIQRIAIVREIVAFYETIEQIVTPISKGRLDLRLSETKLLYQELTGRPYIPLPEQFDMEQRGECHE